MVVQFSTGGRGRDHEQRKRPLSLVPEMASFATGSVNFTNWIYENPPKFIDELAELLLTRNIKPEIEIFEIGRAHVCTPVTNAHLVCRLLLETKQTTTYQTRKSTNTTICHRSRIP